MKSLTKYTIWLILPIACLLLWWAANKPIATEIRSPYQIQLQLIDAGYGKVWVKGEWKVLKADGEWGPISRAAFNQYKADEITKRMANVKR